MHDADDLAFPPGMRGDVAVRGCVGWTLSHLSQGRKTQTDPL
jgi:hypothetical protein